MTVTYIKIALGSFKIKLQMTVLVSPMAHLYEKFFGVLVVEMYLIAGLVGIYMKSWYWFFLVICLLIEVSRSIFLSTIFILSISVFWGIIANETCGIIIGYSDLNWRISCFITCLSLVIHEAATKYVRAISM